MPITIKHPLQSLVAVLTPLGTGTLLYWLFRGIPVLGFPALLHISSHSALVALLAYNIPDGLWLYALLQSIRLIWQNDPFRKGYPAWLALATIGAFGSEIAQYLGLIPGTFDMLDIIMYLLAAGIFAAKHLRHAPSLNSNSI